MRHFLVFSGIRAGSGGLYDSRIIAATDRESAVLQAFRELPTESLMAVCELPDAPVYFQRDKDGRLSPKTLSGKWPR